MNNDLQRGAIEHTDWDVPAFDCLQLRAKRSTYCVVIPVINEGERLTTQLREMAALGQMDKVDVIIADGGSTDGSTEPDLLSELGVAALLVKRGPGKLSAQLRMAYAWALEAGYGGIVTIDGNGKDGVEAIDQFVAALDHGVDYAQASRFIKGGQGVNTPLTRLLAIRFVHAPLLSLAAGKWLTDTTQGFRAYSSPYLLHPKVQPFRAMFADYELLAYLSVRASQLGLAVAEIPTRRVYPDDGSVPTKISAVSGNLGLLKTLCATLTRRYHPN
ncbi:MAG: glycosyltransferase family 2 protein [Alphaproteobacteria bacterium]|nr:glycosyltransferase family 2 protein [Alphaproteobacteria bacterium]